MSLVRRLKSLLQEHLLDMVRFSVALLCSQMHTLLSPLYTKTLEVEDYGQLELIFTLIGLISILLSMGLHQLIGVKFYKVDKKADEIYKVTIIYLLLSLPILLIIFIPSVSEVAGKLLINRQGENELVVLIFIIAHITFFRFFLLSILSASFRTRSYMMLELLVNALYLLLIVIMLISEMLTLHTIVYCILASNIPVAIYYAVYYFKYKTSISTGIFFSVKRSVLPTLRESLPFLGIGITAWVINLMDRWMILVITNDEATLGVYSLAYRLAGMVPLFMTFLVSNMYNRKLYRDLSNQKIDNGVLFKQHNKNLFVYIAVLLIVLPITGISINSMFSSIYPVEYQEAVIYIYFLLIGFFLFSLNTFFGTILHYFARSKEVFVINLVGALVNIILNLILIPIYGAYGAIWSTNITFFIVLLLLRSRSIFLQRKVIA